MTGDICTMLADRRVWRARLHNGRWRHAGHLLESLTATCSERAWHHRRVTAWPAVLTVDPIDRASGAVRLPGSKSISNRVLLLSALADSETTLVGLARRRRHAVRCGLR